MTPELEAKLKASIEAGKARSEEVLKTLSALKGKKYTEQIRHYAGVISMLTQLTAPRGEFHQQAARCILGALACFREEVGLPDDFDVDACSVVDQQLQTWREVMVAVQGGDGL